MKKSEKISQDYLALGSLVAMTLTTGLILSSIHVSANDTTVDDISITVPVSCSLSSTGNDSHTATLPNGIYSGTYTDTTSGVDYTNGIGTTTIKAYCNDNNGFAIYAAGYTGEVVGEENSNKLVGTTTGIGNIDTNLNTTGNTSGWSMKLSITGDSGDTTTNPLTIDSAPNVSLPSQAESGAISASFSDYHVVPNEYVKVAHKNSATDMTANTGGTTLTTTYAAYISQTQPAGTYEGKVIYVMVHPADAAAPIVCKPNGTTISTIACMQDVTTSNISTILASMTEDQQYTLTDIRDNKTYYVAKLKDGNLWMTQNLDLDLDSTKTYTPADTDVAANWKPSLSTYTTGTTTWNNSTTTPESYDPGDVYWIGTTWPTDQTSCEAAGGTWDGWCDSPNLTTTTGDAHYHLGNYYNWSAAVAMNNTSSLTTNGTLVERSICPAGWTLPRSGMDGNWENQLFSEDTFKVLWDDYGFTDSSINGENKLWEAPLYFAASGRWYGMLGSVGVGGYFWTPVVFNEGVAWGAHFDTDGGLNPSYTSSCTDGLSVRCVARPVVSAN